MQRRAHPLTSEGVAPNGLARTHMLILACMPSNLSVHFTQRLKIEIEMREIKIRERKRETETEREIQRQSDQSMIRKMDICGEESAVRARGQDDITVVKESYKAFHHNH